MATDKIDFTHFYRVQQVRFANLLRQLAKDAEKIQRIIDEHNAKVAEIKKNRRKAHDQP